MSSSVSQAVEVSPEVSKSNFTDARSAADGKGGDGNVLLMGEKKMTKPRIGEGKGNPRGKKRRKKKNMDVEEEEDSDCHDDGDDDGSPRRESPTLLIVAHPDDEIMFFTPLLVSFKRLQILSLTAGSFPPSSGPVRCREMKCSCDIFLANGFMDLTILDDDRVRDGPIEGAWDGQERTIFRAINGAVEKLVKEYCTKKGAAPVSAINVVTFDDLGVSGHVNHRDTSRSVKDWYSKLKLAKGGRGGKIFTAQNFGKGAKLDPVSVKLYQLKSLKWWMKYSLTSFHPIVSVCLYMQSCRFCVALLCFVVVAEAPP